MLKPCHAVFGFALLLALLVTSRGQSEQQPPNHTNQTERTQDQPAPNQRGTEQSPFVIKIMPSPESKTDTPEGAKASDEKTKLDRQLVAATWVLGGIAF